MPLLAALAIATVGVVAVTLVTTGPEHSIPPSRSSAESQQPASYSISGLTCPFKSGTPSYVVSLVTTLVQDPRLENATGGSQFVLGNYENITNRVSVVGGNVNGIGETTIHLPDALEFVFYSTTANKMTCEQPSSPTSFLVVQVPVEDKGFNMTAADIHNLPQ